VRHTFLIVICLASLIRSTPAQVAPSPFPAGAVTSNVVCSSDTNQSYALYLPSNYSAARTWPIIYVFDPGARGKVAVETIQTAAEKFGYIVAASNNSRNGPMGGSSQAMKAMWVDTQQRFPIAEQRRYVAGMSGGARVATSVALSCGGCVAGVIASAAGFPFATEPTRDMKFAYFAAVGNADFNYGEFVDLRRKLDTASAHYQIRIFEGQHGWAPPEVWIEALNWMDMQAMSAGTVPRDQSRIQQTLAGEIARARELQSQNNLLPALRKYQSITRNFHALADVASAEASAAELGKNKAVKTAEKEEASAVDQQAQMTSNLSAQIQAIEGAGARNSVDVMDIKDRIADLKKRADTSPAPTDLKALVVRRALGELVVEAYESGQRTMDSKNYRAAVLYFDLAAAGSANPGWAHYQRARAYAMMPDRKKMLAELKVALAGGFHEISAMDAAEFQAFRGQPEFQALAAEWKLAAEKDKAKP
jgi:predicted esterase